MKRQDGADWLLGRRRVVAIASVMFLLGSSVGGVIASRFIVSPAEAAARTAPPEPSLITAPVERVELSNRVILRGVVERGAARAITLAGSPDGEDIEEVVVTRPAELGAELAEGSVALEVSGRPVIVLSGDVPVYRDLRPGFDGDDVGQLEQALQRLGHDPGPVDGVYDAGTAAGVERLYEAAGYTFAGPTDEELAELKAAEQAVVEADRQVHAAETAQQAGIDLVEQADAAVRIARLRAAADVAAADEQVARARLLVSQREELLGVLQQEGAAATDGAEAELRLQQARDELAGAIREAEIIRTEGQASIDAAQDALDQARGQAASGGSAQRAVAAELAAARQQAESAREELTALQRSTGTIVPASELVFLSGLPLRVEKVSAGLGAPASGELLTVSTNHVVVKVQVSEQESELISEGDLAEVEASGTGVLSQGTVTSVVDDAALSRPEAEEGPGGPASGAVVEIALPDSAQDLVDAAVRVVIPVHSTNGEVLAVPLTALSTSDGSTRVEVAEPEGGTRSVQVHVGLQAQDLVEVRPLQGALREGDQVVIGRDIYAAPAD